MNDDSRSPRRSTVTSLHPDKGGTFVKSTRVYVQELVPNKLADSSGPEGVRVTLERMIVHGRYVPVKRSEKHHAVYYDPHNFEPTYLRRVR